MKTWGVLLLVLGAAGCSKEARTLEPDQPQSAPTGPGDPRVSRFEGNAYQVSQGGRYFTWYGCGGCHAQGAKGVLALDDGQWRYGDAVDQVYRSIADRHGGHRYGVRVPAEQLWQLTAYVRQLPTLDPGKRRRQDFDQAGEPQERAWNGPVR